MVYSKVDCRDEMTVIPSARSLVYLTVRLMELQSETRMVTQMGQMMAHLTEMKKVKQLETSLDELMEGLLAWGLVRLLDVGSETLTETLTGMHLDQLMDEWLAMQTVLMTESG